MFIMSEVDNEYITIAAAARRLGVSAQYLYKLIDQGRLTSYTREINDRKLLKWAEVRQKFELRPLKDGEE